MDLKTDIKLLVAKLFNRKGKSLFECADHVGRSSGYLSQVASIHRETPITFHDALKLMKFKNEYELLEFACHYCGFVPVKLPKFKMSKGDENELTQKYHEVVFEAARAVMDYLKLQDGDRFEIAMRALTSAVQESLSVKQYIIKKQSRQEELFT